MEHIISFAYRTPSTFSVQSLSKTDNTFQQIFELHESIKLFLYSSNGKYLALISNLGVKVYAAETMTIIYQKDLSNVNEAVFSPLSTYLCIYCRIQTSAGVNTSDTGLNLKNCYIIDIDKNNEILSYFHRNTETWSPQWSIDEKYFVRVRNASTEIQVFYLNDLETPRFKFSCEGISAFSLSPTIIFPKIAVFTTGKGNNPAMLRLFNIAKHETPAITKTFFKAEKANLYWNHNGQNLLVLTSTEVDGTGKSYYGESSLSFICSDGSFDCHVQLSKEGPIHDLSWSPNTDEFIVVYGYMPAKVTLFDVKCRSIYQFGSVSKNFIRFNSPGSIICLAGFGNLAGDIELWDRETLKKFAEWKGSGSTACEWSSDGKHLLLATLSPRLRVDNGYKIYDYFGNLLLQTTFKELNQIEWRPCTKDKVQKFKVDLKATKKSPVSNAPTKSSYIPPSLRGRTEVRVPVGMDPSLVKTISGGKKPVTKQIPPMAFQSFNHHESNPPPDSKSKLSPNEKLIKGLQRKLDQIQLLKAKKEAGIPLEINQLEKIEKEEEYNNELSQLSFKT